MSTVPEVEFVDGLPAGGAGGGRPPELLTVRLAALVERPKEWAIIERRPTKAVSDGWKKRAARPANAGHRWEFATRGGAVYARYMGEAE
jgi:hypothetical protein